MVLYDRRLWVVVVALILASCGTMKNSTSDSSSNRIVINELSTSVSGVSAYDVVEQHRSFWLTRRGTDSIRNPNPIKVYLDGSGSSYGDVSALRDIPADEVESIEYFDASKAQMRFGLDNSSGAIVVYTKGGQ